MRDCIDIVYNQYWILVSSILLKYNFLILLFCFRRRKCIFMTQTKWVSTVWIDIWYYITSHWNSIRIELTWFTRRGGGRFKNIYIIQIKNIVPFTEIWLHRLCHFCQIAYCRLSSKSCCRHLLSTDISNYDLITDVY